MSLQELDPMAEPSASVKVETMHAKPLLHVVGGKLWSFRQNHPQFFTPKVVENRTADLPAGKAFPKKNWEPVSKKISEKQKTHIALHRNLKDGTFFFRSQSDDTLRMPIGRDILLIAIAAVKGSEWVQMKAGGHTLCLHRAELRIAFKKLES